jgi:glycosyltransferase involved in cell wall biosynthesis/O-antigen/teichoic acid export membrane protein/O-antigen ligase
MQSFSFRSETSVWQRIGVTLVPGTALLVRWFLILLFVLLPLDVYLVLPPHQPVAFASQILAVEAAGMLIVSLLLARVFRGAARVASEWADLWPLGAICVVGACGVVGATDRTLAAKGVLRLVVYLAIYLVARAVRYGAAFRSSALVALVVGALVVLSAGWLGIIPGAPDVFGVLLNVQRTAAQLPNSPIVRAEATFRYPNELAAYLLLLIPILVAMCIKVPTRAERVSFAMFAVLCGWLLVLTYTRGALIAMLVALPVLLFAVGGRRIALYGVLAVALAGIGLVVAPGGQGHRFLTVLSLSDPGYTNRVAIWQWALRVFAHHPLVGVGLDNLHLQPNAPYLDATRAIHAVDAENLLLNVLAELGLAGALLVTAAFVGALRRAWWGIKQDRNWLDQGWNAGVFGGVVALLIYGLVDPVLVSGQVTGLLCALVGLAGPLRDVGQMETHRLSHHEAMQDVAALPTARLTPPAATATDLADVATLQLTAMRAPQLGPLAGTSALLSSRIVFLVNARGFGGAELHSINMAEALRQHGENVLVVCPPGAQYLPHLEAHQVPYRTLDMGMNAGRVRGVLGTLALFSPLSRWRTFKQLRDLVAEAPTIFVCPFPREQVLVTLFGQKHNAQVIWVCHAPLHYLAHRLVVRRVLVRLAPKAGACIAISAHLAGLLLKAGYPGGNIEVIPNAVPRASTDETNHPRAHPLRIGVASRLTRAKGIQVLLHALPAILDWHPAADLVIAGSGRYRQALVRLAARLGLGASVRFTGYIAETEPFYRDLGVFVCPSIDPAEGLPTVILEAMSNGVPIVATAVGGVPELIRDQESGILVPPGDTEALARAVVGLLGDEATAGRIGAAGRAVVQDGYTIERAASRLLKVLRGLAQRGDGGMTGGATSGEVRAVRGASLMGGTSMLFVGKVLTALATAMWTVLAARTLLPAAYGNLLLCAGLVELGAIITDAGITSAATRELAQAPESQSRSLIGTLIYLKLLLGMVATAVTIGVTFLLPFGTEVHKIMLVLGPGLIFVALSSLTLIFRARMAIGYVLITAFAGALVGTYGAALVYWVAPSVTRFAVARVAMLGVTGLLTLAIILYRLRPSLRFNRQIARAYIRSGLLLGIALALNILYYRLDVPLLALLTNTTQVAIYASAYRILDVVTLLPAAASSVALPLMVAARRDSERHLATFSRQYLELAVAAGLLIAVTLTLLGKPLLWFLYGGHYDRSGPTLQVLAWVAAATLVTNVFLPLMVAMARQRVVLLATALGLVVNVAANLVLIPRLGAVAAAYATLITEFAVTAPLVIVAVRTLNMRLWSRPIFAAFLATATALFVALALQRVTAASVVSGALGIVVWVAVLGAVAPRWIVSQINVARFRRQARLAPTVALAQGSATPVAGDS